MGVLDQVTQMRNQNMSDKDIADALKKQKVSYREIQDALNHSQIKNAVTDIQGAEPDMQPPSPQDYQNAGDAYNPNAGSYDPNAGYDPQQGYGQDPNAGYEQQYQPGGYQPQQSNTDTIVEVSNQVFEEKIKDFSKKMDSMEEFKTLTQTKIDQISERLKRVESVMDKLQAAILEKIGSYGNDLSSIKKEMNMMQDTFSKTMGKVMDKTKSSTRKTTTKTK